MCISVSVVLKKNIKKMQNTTEYYDFFVIIVFENVDIADFYFHSVFDLPFMCVLT